MIPNNKKRKKPTKYSEIQTAVINSTTLRQDLQGGNTVLSLRRNTTSIYHLANRPLSGAIRIIVYTVLSKPRTAEPAQTTAKLRKLEFMSAPKGIRNDGSGWKPACNVSTKTKGSKSGRVNIPWPKQQTFLEGMLCAEMGGGTFSFVYSSDLFYLYIH